MTTRSTPKSPGARSADHTTFVIERVLDATPARVFSAWADPRAKARWFVGPPEQWKESVREHDFRVGGRDRLVGTHASGKVSAYDSTYLEIVPDARIIYAYQMHVDEARISVSLSTVELRPEGSRTRMVYTEQVVFLDGFEDGGSRERGTQALFDQLTAALGQ